MIANPSHQKPFVHAKLQKLFEEDLYIDKLPYAMYWQSNNLIHLDDTKSQENLTNLAQKLAEIDYKEDTGKYIVRAFSNLQVDLKDIEDGQEVP